MFRLQAGSGSAGMDVEAEATSPSLTVLCGARSGATNTVQLAISDETSLQADAVNAGEKMLQETPADTEFVFTKKVLQVVPQRLNRDLEFRQHMAPV